MIKSPCKNICEFDSESDFCMGCLRTGFEIFNWINFNDKEKLVIITKLKCRNIKKNLKKDTHKNAC